MPRHADVDILAIGFVASSVNAGPVSVLDGSVRFTPPSDFRLLTADEIAEKFPRANAPAAAYANESGGASVSVTYSPAAVTPDGLDELKHRLEMDLPRMVPGMEWLARETVVVDGRSWIHFEFKANAIDTGIHNNIYITSHHGRMLGFNFNATISEYPEYAAELARSFESIRIND